LRVAAPPPARPRKKKTSQRSKKVQKIQKMSSGAPASAPQTPDPNYEFFAAPKYVDFANMPTDAELDAWFATRGDSSPTFVKAPVLFSLEQEPVTPTIAFDDDMMSAASNDTGLVPISVALVDKFDNLESDVDEIDATDNDENVSEESFDSVATEVIHFANASAAATPTTPHTAKTTQMLQRCDAAQDDLTQRINTLKSQIQQLRATVPQAPAVQPPPPTTPRPTDPTTPRAATTASGVNTPRSAYLEAVARIKKNIGLVANKESELQQLQDLQREMHLSGGGKTVKQQQQQLQQQQQQQQQHRHHRHSSVYRSGASRHTSAVRVLRTESTFSTPHEKRTVERAYGGGDLTAPIRLMATGPMRVVDPSAAPPPLPQQQAFGAATPGTIQRQPSLMLTGALRIDTAAAIEAAAAEMAADDESDDEVEQLRPARPSSVHRRHSHAQPETPRRSHSHRTPRSPLMYDEQEVGADAERHRHRRRRHHHHHHRHSHINSHMTPRSALRGSIALETETPLSTHRSHRRRTDVEDNGAARTTRKERRRRSHTHRSNHLRTTTAPSTPHAAAEAAPITRQRSFTVGAMDDNEVRRQLAGALEQVQCNDLPRFMQPTESAAMRVIETQRDNSDRKAQLATTVSNPRDHWDIVQPATVKHSISQLDREAIQRAQATAALSPPPLPGPPTTMPPRQLVRGWTLRPVNEPTQQQAAPLAIAKPAPPTTQPPARAIARTESLATAAPTRSVAPVARSSTMTSVAGARQPFAPMATNTRTAPSAAPKAKRGEGERALTTEEREMLAIAEARRKLHQHVMAQSVGMPKFIRRPRTATNPN
jgi:hypothetical protein